jgi:hypothetical protein
MRSLLEITNSPQLKDASQRVAIAACTVRGIRPFSRWKHSPFMLDSHAQLSGYTPSPLLGTLCDAQLAH